MRSLSLLRLLAAACGICFLSAWLLQFASSTHAHDGLLNQRAGQSLILIGGYFGLLAGGLVIRSLLTRSFGQRQ